MQDYLLVVKRETVAKVREALDWDVEWILAAPDTIRIKEGSKSLARAKSLHYIIILNEEAGQILSLLRKGGVTPGEFVLQPLVQ